MLRTNRLSVALGRSGKCWVAMLTLALWFTNAVAGDTDDWLSRSRQIMETAPNEPPPPWLRVTPGTAATEWAREIADGSLPEQPTHRVGLEAPGRVLIFASLSVPAETLRALLEQAHADDVVVIFRGVPHGATIQTAMKRLHALIPKDQPAPNVVIDPTEFRRYDVTVVPTLVLVRDRGQPPVVVSGAVTVPWLRRMAATVARGSENLGRRAETYDIGEPDFVLEMQQRLAAIDWNAQRSAAMAHFWSKHHDFVTLPDAQRHREFLVDPTVELTSDLEDAQGHTLARAGERWNPLEWMTLSKTIVVFRGTDARQVAAAKAAADAAAKAGHGVILLTTDIDVDHGWDHLGALETALSGTVYILPQSLVDRFHLQAVPSTVVSHGRELLVTEISPGSGK